MTEVLLRLEEFLVMMWTHGGNTPTVEAEIGVMHLKEHYGLLVTPETKRNTWKDTPRESSEMARHYQHLILAFFSLEL